MCMFPYHVTVNLLYSSLQNSSIEVCVQNGEEISRVKWTRS
jgi:hypothetical protein